MQINSCLELWNQWIGETEESEERAKAMLEKYIFKGTKCGCSFSASEKGVIVAGYAEGSDADLNAYGLEFPFRLSEFVMALDQADKEGCAAWHEANDEDLQRGEKCDKALQALREIASFSDDISETDEIMAFRWSSVECARNALKKCEE